MVGGVDRHASRVDFSLCRLHRLLTLLELATRDRAVVVEVAPGPLLLHRLRERLLVDDKEPVEAVPILFEGHGQFGRAPLEQRGGGLGRGRVGRRCCWGRRTLGPSLGGEREAHPEYEGGDQALACAHGVRNGMEPAHALRFDYTEAGKSKLRPTATPLRRRRSRSPAWTAGLRRPRSRSR